jgi:hypothetical protein
MIEWIIYNNGSKSENTKERLLYIEGVRERITPFMNHFIGNIMNSSDFSKTSKAGDIDIIQKIFNDTPKPLIPTMILLVDKNLVRIQYNNNVHIYLTTPISIIKREVRLNRLLD